MADVLRAKNLTVSSAGGIAVLRDISFAVARGKIIGLVGESGAGKSMLGRVIAANLPGGFRVTGGSLDFGGADLTRITGEARRQLLGREIAFIPQEPLTSLNPVLTIGQQFSEHLARIGGLPRSAFREHIVQALADVRLRNPEDLLQRYPFQLSGGMCQRVLIAMAFAAKPALVIADEPTTALDVSTQATVVQIMRRLQREQGTAMVFITHDLRLAARVCNRIAVLYAGEVIEEGPAGEVLEAPRHPYTRVLKAANPVLSGPRHRLRTLPDQMPTVEAFARLPGCRFATRCPVADPACAAAIPTLREIAPAHFVRCSDACGEKAAALVEAEPILVPPAADKGSEPVLVLEGLSKHYPGKADWLGRRKPGTDAVKNVGLTVRRGEFIGIVGESGSGKSTLARLIAGLETPTDGRILVAGEDVTRADSKARALRLETLQMVFQDPQSALNPRRSIDHIVTQAMEPAGASRAERLERARSLLAETKLSGELLERYPAQLSGGQKQRVNIARALCVTPHLLIADEIVSGLDVSVQAQILNLLLDLRAARDLSLVLISHDLAVVRYLCSRVVIMHHGVVVEEGEVDRVFGDPQHPYTRQLIAAVPPDDLDTPWPAPVAVEPDNAEGLERASI
ncbi:dipeptide ABC transporter ATP-binding protein [Chelatococcus asaccharovorans]|uniref:dipeptide ABC transporter ATP-binding protein n=1 Tax=Chelatococcus asaccharovorans TaxID=28210 RepID=UPI00224C70F6|nr:ABC transporter ATP-binding protein [Chelatococcus asaccharovorans]CAH1648850.1 Peptide/nickel transport system ATP-binding protein [Chelatococcus asaccharovorans]CAH1691096.1 Peptide/nickel transport system ATP-binding protein [Chelatococcus asaccharovorans]